MCGVSGEGAHPKELKSLLEPSQHLQEDIQGLETNSDTEFHGTVEAQAESIAYPCDSQEVPSIERPTPLLYDFVVLIECHLTGPTSSFLLL